MKLNRKGYMLVEIILASVLAMSIAFYLLNLTYDFKNKNEDIYQDITYSSDKIAITRNIMNDLDRVRVTTTIIPIVEKDSLYEYSFSVKIKKNNQKEERRLKIEKISGITTIQYGKWENNTNTFVTTDVSYYKKQLQNTLIVGEIKSTSNLEKEYLTVEIPISSLYSDEDYNIKLFVQKEWKNFPLSEAMPGSYVTYTGNNGCEGESCNGQNANYKDETNKGYCHDDNYKYNSNGWRVAYTKDNTAYLISGGSPECNTLGYLRNIIERTLKISPNQAYYFTTTKPKITIKDSSQYYFKYASSSLTSYEYPTDVDNIEEEMYMLETINNTSITTNEFFYVTEKNADQTIKMKKITFKYKETKNSFKSDELATYWGTTLNLYQDKFQISDNIKRELGDSIYKYGCIGTKVTCKTLYVYNNGKYDVYTLTSDDNNTIELKNGYAKYCSSYVFIDKIKKFVLNDCITGNHYNQYAQIIGTYKYTCGNSNNECNKLYEILDTSTRLRQKRNEITVNITNILNKKATKYCNPNYAYNDICNEESVWAMNANDFKQITGEEIDLCYKNLQGICSVNDLIDNGGYYWNVNSSTTDSIYYYWSPNNSYYDNSSNLAYGLRPVIRMKEEVMVTGGEGTKEEPYIIEIR